MHDTALRTGALFFARYLPKSGQVRVLDVGGLDVNGSLRPAARPEWSYTAVDMVAGNGVDIVLEDPYKLPFDDGTFDAVVSTSCFEHDALFWLSFLEMLRVTRPGGYLYVNAPSNGLVHRYPIDAYRFYPDAGISWVEWANRNGVAVTLYESFIGDPGRENLNDFVAVFRKGTFERSDVPPIFQTVTSANIRAVGVDGVLNRRSNVQKSWSRRIVERFRWDPYRH